MPGALPVLLWKFIWHDAQPREEKTYIIRMSTQKIIVPPRIKSLFVNILLKPKIVILYQGNRKLGSKARFHL